MERHDVGYLLNRAARHLRLSLGEALTEIELRPQQAAVIMAIARNQDRRLTPGAVADAIDTDAATTSGLLERLTRDGWLSAAPNPNDGRSRLFTLTDKADRALPGVMAIAQAVSAEATSCFSKDDLDTLVQLLQRLCARRDDEGTGVGVR